MITFNFKKWDTLLGWSVFLIALVTYSLTVEPTVSFWDCGEYIATSAKLQVGHPPGAPLYQIVGAFFAMFAVSKEQVALMVNMVSVFSSAFTILFMFWSGTLLLKKIVLKSAPLNNQNAIAILGATAIGCLAYTFSDSFWFNATEAEVYAMASLFIALLLWLALRWEQDYHTPRANRWLLLIALVTGLSFGVHFMALLTLPAVGFIYFFKKFQRVTFLNFIVANVVVVAILGFIFLFLMPYTLAIFGWAEIFAVNTLGMPFNYGTIITFAFMVLSFVVTLWFTRKRGYIMLNTILLCLLFVMMGFSVWLMLPIRANANTVINENRPGDAAEVLAYYNREQYGDQKLFYGPMYTEMYVGNDPEKPYLDEKPNYQRDTVKGAYVIVNDYKNARNNSNSSQKGFMPRMWSTTPGHVYNYMVFSAPPAYSLDAKHNYSADLRDLGIDTLAMSKEDIKTEANKHKVAIQSEVEEFTVGYHSGKYGLKEYNSFLQNYGNYLNIERPSLAENLSFMFEYQFGYMYWRYLMWNFSGRQNDVNGHYESFDGNWLTGFSLLDSPRLTSQHNLPPDVANDKTRNIYYMLPFILGVIGLVYHARKDAKSLYVLLLLFLFTGFILKIYLNERPFEPRERDYALVGSFYAFSIWIGLGAYAVYAFLQKRIKHTVVLPVSLAVCFLAVPMLMAAQNWDDHNRGERYTALASAKAYLDSCAPNAILFTLADNDTFPLWYAQEIEGYRTDVRIVNSNLLSMDWYVDQMKRRAYNSAPMPIRFTPEQYVQGTRDFALYEPKSSQRISLDSLMKFIAQDTMAAKVKLRNGHWAHYYPTHRVRLDVPREKIIESNMVAPQKLDAIVPYIDINLPQSALYKNRIMMLDIIANNNWERPVYFTGGTSAKDDFLWMRDYLQLEGMVYRLVPVKTTFPEEGTSLDLGGINTQAMYKIVMGWDWGNSDTNIYHDPETRRSSVAMRNNMARLARALNKEGNHEQAEDIADLAITKMPLDDYGYYSYVTPFTGVYYKAGNPEKAEALLDDISEKFTQELDYYTALPEVEIRENGGRVAASLEYYRKLLQVAKKNGDTLLYEKHREKFNAYNAKLKMLGAPNE